jgi:Tfp pilus assembly protein PilV
MTDASQLPQKLPSLLGMSNDLVRTNNTESKVQEVDEQQWVLDTLIEIIRIRDEQLPSDDELARPENLFSDRSSRISADVASSTVSPKNLEPKDREAQTVGDFTNRQQSSTSIANTGTGTTEVNSTTVDTQLNSNKLHMDRITSGNPMETISRMDKNTAIETESNLFSKERKDKLMAAASTIANMLPHSSLPRPAASRDESLKYLIHHLQSLQRESKE